MLFQCWRSKLNHSQQIITKCDGIITNCDSLLYYKVRWTVVTNCDSFFITKCDTVYYKLRQVLQSAMNLLQIPIGITKCDDHYKLRQYICPKSLTAWITIISWLSCADLAWCSRLLLPGFLAIYYSESRAGPAVYLRNTSYRTQCRGIPGLNPGSNLIHHLLWMILLMKLVIVKWTCMLMVISSFSSLRYQIQLTPSHMWTML